MGRSPPAEGDENQQGFDASERPRPGNRETDPNRDDRRR